MIENDKWKTVLGYAAGIVILAVALILAWFLPGWYSRWQDERLMGQVTLSNRENIEFLDGDSLDIAGRLEKLGSAEQLEWGTDYSYGYYDYNYYGYASGNWNQEIERCKKVLAQWWDAGLLSVDCKDWIREENMLVLRGCVLYVDQNALPVYFMAFSGETENSAEYGESLENKAAENYAVSADAPELLLVIMDSEKEMVYYASVAGTRARDAMARELGYESQYHFYESLYGGEARLRKEIDVSKYDFASICGAESAEITSNPGQLDLLVSLKYDNFDGYASRVLIHNEAGYGMAVMFGTARWPQLVTTLLGERGSSDQMLTTDLWEAFILDSVDDIIVTDILAEMQYHGEIEMPGENSAVDGTEEAGVYSDVIIE